MGMKNSLLPIPRPAECTQKFHENRWSRFGGVLLQTLWYKNIFILEEKIIVLLVCYQSNIINV